MVGKIGFYSKDEKYGWLSNFYQASQVVQGVMYKSNEHYYQSQKARDNHVHDWISNAPSPFLAMKAGRSLRKDKELTDVWESIKIDVMRTGLYAKFTQNPELKQMLLDTGDDFLYEDSPTDMFWGVKGKNMLGILLMELRTELRRK